MTVAEDPIEGNETTPLLPKDSTSPRKYGKSVLYRALFGAFLVSLSFGVTQVPLIYVFRLMTCEAYYQDHPEPPPGSDKCSLRDIEASTARAVTLLGASTTLFGVLNLFITGWTMKRFGIKTGLLISVFWPAIRLLIQNIGVEVGGGKGIIIIQASQIITIVGGPAGYLLALNSYVTEILEPSERTGALGKLQGVAFIGNSIAFLIGGIIGDVFGIASPFRVTVILFLSSSIYIFFALPRIPPLEDVTGRTGIAKFFGPLKVFAPQKWVLDDGRTVRHYGMILLGLGVFLSVLATGYIPTLLQMYATDIFGFGTTKNGYLVSLNSFLRGMFLTLIFPRIISAGRALLAKDSAPRTLENGKCNAADIPDLPHQPNDFAEVPPMEGDQEPIEPPKPSDEKETFEFDLQYTRYSILADAILTGAATFVAQGWQMYVVAAVLPFAAGTGASAKGTILQMCTPGERTDALSSITLVEMCARLATTAVFGLGFSAFAQIGQTYLIFTFNAAVALLGFLVLLFTRFPPENSRRFQEEISNESQQQD